MSCCGGCGGQATEPKKDKETKQGETKAQENKPTENKK